MKRRTFLKKGTLATSGLITTHLLVAGYRRVPFLEKEGHSVSSETADIEVLVLEGSPRKRGLIHGESLKPKIQEFISLWKEDLQKSRRTSADKYIDEFLEKTNFLPAVKKWTPDVLEEMKAIGEGAGVDFKTIFAFNLQDEEWVYGLKVRQKNADAAPSNCSSLGVGNEGDHPSLVAQNMDLPTFFDGFQTLLHIKHPNSDLESFAFTCAGLLATCGMNNKALGICCNTLLQLNHSSDGLPVAFIVRGVLEQSKFEDAIKFVNNIKHASGQNYIIGGAEKAIDLECSANKVSQFIPYEGATRVYHTNHPLINDDQSSFREMFEKLPPDLRKKAEWNTEVRFNSLENRLKDASKKVTVETVKAILGSHDSPENPVCVHKNPKGGAMTAGGLIMVLSSSPELHLALPPPCSKEFKIFRF